MEELNHGRVISSVLFLPFILERHPTHYGHSLFCQSNPATEDTPRTCTKKSVEHNALRSNDGRWFSWVSLGTALLSFVQTSSCSPFSSSSIEVDSYDILTSRTLVLLCV